MSHSWALSSTELPQQAQAPGQLSAAVSRHRPAGSHTQTRLGRSVRRTVSLGAFVVYFYHGAP
eukprot:13208084-Alexandrium_andersonii.AAC.1